MGDAPGPGTDEQTRPPPMDEDTFLQGLAHCLQTVRRENPALIPGARPIPKGAGREAVSPAAVTAFRSWIWEETYLTVIVLGERSKAVYANRLIKTTFLAVRALHWLLYLPTASGNMNKLARQTNFLSSKNKTS